MRRVRPTLKVIKELPATPSVDASKSIIARVRAAKDRETRQVILRELRFEDLECNLISDADRILDAGVNDRHEDSTAAYGATVYEARDHVGAGYRGAVIVYNATEPWLVHADRHDHFHSHAAKTLRRTVPQQKSNATMPFDPTALDLFVRDLEDERVRTRLLQRQLISDLVDGLRLAHEEERTVELRTPEDPAATDYVKSVPYTLTIEHDEPAETFDLANASTCAVTLLISQSEGPWSMLSMLIQCGVIFVQPDVNYHRYMEQGSSLELELTVTHAKLTQLLTDADLEETEVPPVVSEPTHLHHARKDLILDGRVNGAPVPSLCGRWFVPTKDEKADLPVCGSCEAQKPHAQALLDVVRDRL